MSGSTVDPTARIAPGARLGDGVTVGPYCVIGGEVSLGPGCRLDAHVVLDGRTQVGPECRFFPFVSAGGIPQDLKFSGEATRLEIGAHNTFREFVTLNLGTDEGGGVTRIGSRNFFMASSARLTIWFGVVELSNTSPATRTASTFRSCASAAMRSTALNRSSRRIAAVSPSIEPKSLPSCQSAVWRRVMVMLI